MTEEAVPEEAMPKSVRPTHDDLPLLERLGVRYFRRLSDAFGKIDAGDGVAYLNPNERKALRRVVRFGVTRAAIAGALSTVVSGTAELIARHHLHPDSRHATWHTQVQLWTVIALATAGASVVEISFLYWDGLRTVHELAREAGLELFPEGERTAVAQAMARAALELPNPTAAVFGVDPRREASKLGLFFASIVYKLKISVSNFLVKALVRRALSRAFVRAWLPLVAVPVTATWNGIVAWLILREARVRAMGPSAAIEMIGVLFENAHDLSDLGRAAALRAVASSIVRTRDMHPN
ncbi:MAG: LBF_2804 family protein, partial [Polyangiaceae bacterium]